MELWIRSQDKKVLFKIDNVGINDYNGYFYVVSIIKGEEVKLGKYEFHNSTRALEVLDEIQNKLQPLLYLKPNTKLELETISHAKKYFQDLNGVNFITCDNNFKIEPITTNVIVYEMPEN